MLKGTITEQEGPKIKELEWEPENAKQFASQMKELKRHFGGWMEDNNVFHLDGSITVKLIIKNRHSDDPIIFTGTLKPEKEYAQR